VIAAKKVLRAPAGRSVLPGGHSAFVPDTLFAERFVVLADASGGADGAAHLYDETRNLTVTPEGLPSVELGTTASTDTGTFAGPRLGGRRVDGHVH
jgi:hypothetical protein